ncbi:hypothetical protein [Acanthopleuribacter pedis]|uniref:Uncharacterized protein n=1 Tax=Acanthopleuribacter pedis TaxID=442870 RepID=A0A8J7U353_9BACT|nr:hypothetical protein [Acanthopleuribacter pedis]MBO1317968.1 hypothetical protein [Acanthopleuribacter pedis]
MFGKDSRINSGLRKIIAKISREFHFPRVTVVRCRIDTGVVTWRDRETVPIQTLPTPSTAVNQRGELVTTEVQHARLDPATVLTAQPLSQMEATVRGADCWQAESFPIHNGLGEEAFDPAEIHDQDLAVEAPRVRATRYRFPPKKIKSPRLTFNMRLHSNLGYGRMLPMLLPVHTMDQLPKKLVIRFRAGVLKTLQVKPNQVKFVGACLMLPAAPLKFVRFEPKRLDSLYRAHAVISGAPSTLHAGRSWVFIQRENQPGIFPVIVREA